jgi:O-antigen ligase
LNWPAIKNITAVQIGIFLALILIVMSPHFSMRLPSVLLGLFGVWLVWTRRIRPFADIAARRLTLIFALMLIPILLSIPTSLDWRFSAFVAIAVALYFLVGLALMHALRGDEQRLWLIKWLTIFMLVWAVDGLIQYIFGRDLLGIPLYGDGRVTGFFSRGNMSLATMLAILLPIPMWYFMRKNLMAMFSFFILAGVVAVLVGLRGTLVMMSVTAVGTALRLPLRYRFWFIAVVLVVAASVSLSPVMKERLQRFSEFGTMTFEQYDILSSGRLTIWETAGKMFVDRPLTGVGVGVFARAYDRYSTRPDDMFRSDGSFGSPFHAHNVYVSIAAETGILGLLGIVVAFVLGLKWYYAAPPPRREQAWPYAFGLLIAMFPFNFEYSLYKLWFFSVPLLLLTAMLSALEEPSAASGAAKTI